MAKNSTRIKRSNCTSLEHNISKKNNNTSNIIEEGPQDQTIENIMRYSRVTKAIKTNYFGPCLIVLN